MSHRSPAPRSRLGITAHRQKLIVGTLALGLLLLGACESQNQDPPATDRVSSEELAPQGDASALQSTEAILKDGFYGQDGAAELDTLTPATGTDDGVQQSTAPQASPGKEVEPAKAPSPQAAFIEDFEFSTAADGTAAIEQIKQEPYCLGITSKIPQGDNVSPYQACLRISNRLASVTRQGCTAANLQPSQCYSVSGFPILISEFPPLNDKQPQGRILVLGGMHGDELTSVSIAFKWIEKLNKHHSGLFHWRIAPMMNPDGVLQRAASRTNRNGVDLNRNMPSDDWEANALSYWEDKQSKDPRRYPGEQAASEPETQWLLDEINTFKPDAIISVHAPFGVVDFDSLVLSTAPKNLGKLYLNLLGTYPGSLGNYAGINRNIPVITLELPHAWVMPSELETAKIWEDIVGWLRENVGRNLADSEN